jgi:predicted nuclease of predicted toxin-antitoxin system
MKLLFDENLSPKLPGLVAASFPGSQHVRDCGLLGRSDDEVWAYARDHGFAIVSKDSDFQQRILLLGHPPKLVWLRIGNCTRDQIVRLIASHEREILSLGRNPFEAALVL